jgi:hypothetical protein
MTEFADCVTAFDALTHEVKERGWPVTRGEIDIHFQMRTTSRTLDVAAHGLVRMHNFRVELDSRTLLARVSVAGLVADEGVFAPFGREGYGDRPPWRWGLTSRIDIRDEDAIHNTAVTASLREDGPLTLDQAVREARFGFAAWIHNGEPLGPNRQPVRLGPNSEPLDPIEEPAQKVGGYDARTGKIIASLGDPEGEPLASIWSVDEPAVVYRRTIAWLLQEPS